MRVGPLVLHVDHVGPVLGDLAEQRGELAGPVRAAHGDPQVAAGRGQAVLDHPQHQQRVDVAAGEHRHHRRLHLDHAGQQRGHADRAGRLDHLLAPLQQHQQRPGDVLLGDRDDLVDQLADVGEGQLPGPADRDAVGDRRERRQPDRLAGLQRGREGRGARRPAPRSPVRPAAAPWRPPPCRRSDRRRRPR